jgi:RND family efflux transporter MFP subunit
MKTYLTSRHHAVVLSIALVLLAAPVAAEEWRTLEVQSLANAGGFTAEARIEAVRSATIAAQIAGRVTEIRVEPGQVVRKGELLLQIDSREQAGANAAGQAQLAQASAAWQRSQQLFAQKFISRGALDQAELAYKAAVANAGVTAAGVSHAQVVSPINGVVGERLIEPGELATPGRPLLTVFEPGAVRAVASVAQSRLSALKSLAGEKTASIEISETGERLVATRIEILPTLDPTTHTGTVRLYFAANAPLRPGMAVRARLPGVQAAAISVPASAMVYRGEVTGVYVLAADSKPRLRQVRLGERSGNDIEILAGLSAGERVLLDPIKATVSLPSSPSKRN